MTAQEQIATFIDECIQDTDCFLVEYKVKPTNNFKVYLDADSGFTLEKSITINRALRKKIEEAELFPEGDFSIEVSSPGIDTPLKLLRQYAKNIGRKLEIEFTDEEKEIFTGRLEKIEDETITLTPTPKSNRAKQKAIALPSATFALAEIKKATVCIEF